jgi:hypothetical protein
MVVVVAATFDTNSLGLELMPLPLLLLLLLFKIGVVGAFNFKLRVGGSCWLLGCCWRLLSTDMDVVNENWSSVSLLLLLTSSSPSPSSLSLEIDSCLSHVMCVLELCWAGVFDLEKTLDVFSLLLSLLLLLLLSSNSTELKLDSFNSEDRSCLLFFGLVSPLVTAVFLVVVAVKVDIWDFRA